MKSIFLLLLIPAISFTQVTPKANTIIVKGMTYSELLNALLDKGYSIEKKDNELQTVRTENKEYPKKWNAAYKISGRVKDSTVYLTGTFTSPYSDPLGILPPGTDPLFKDDPIYNDCNAQGQTRTSSLIGYAFTLLNEFAMSLGKPLEYEIRK